MSLLRAMCLLALVAIPTTTALALAEPASQGNADPAADDKPALMSLHYGIIQITPPPEPFRMTAILDTGKGAMYREPGGAAIRVYVMASKAPKNEDWAKFMSEDIIQRLIINRRSITDIKPIQNATAVKDDRFDLMIQESWENKEGKQSGQWHYYQYRNIRPHLFVVTFASPLADEAHVQRLREIAEKIALDASLVPRGTKAPPAPDPTKVINIEHEEDDDDDAGEEDDAKKDEKKPAMSADVEKAQKTLDDAIASVDAQLEKNPEFIRVKGAADEAQKRLVELRAADPPDRAAIATASQVWIEGKGKVQAMRREAHAKDPSIAEAKRRLEQAKARR